MNRICAKEKELRMKYVSLCLIWFTLAANSLMAVSTSVLTLQDGSTDVVRILMSDRMVNDPTITIKGILFCTDYYASKKVYNDSAWHEFADQHDLVIIWKSWDNKTEFLPTILNTWAPLIGNKAATDWNRPELAGLTYRKTSSSKPAIPWIWTGVSAAGQMAMYFAQIEPEGSLAVLNYRGRTYGQFSYSDPVPMLQCQSFSEQVVRMEDQYDDATIARNTYGAPVTSVLQYTAGHNALGDYTFAMEWLSTIISLRYPTNGVFDVDTNPLRPIDMNAVTAGGRYTLSNNNSATGTTNGDYSYDNTSLEPFVEKSTDTWLPTQKLADMWLAANSRHTLTFQMAGTGSGTLNKTTATAWGTEDISVSVTPDATSTFERWEDSSGNPLGTDPTLVLDNIIKTETITAIVNTTNTFSSWATMKGLSGNPAADYDSDGVADFVEYALDLDPLTMDATSVGSYSMQPSDDVRYSFRKPISAITYKVQYTTDLKTLWQDYTGNETDNGTTLSFTLPSALSNGTNLFIRLHLEE